MPYLSFSQNISVVYPCASFGLIEQEKLSVGGSTMANSRDRDVSTNNDTVTGVKSVKKLRAPGPPSTDIVTPSHSLHSVDSIDLTAADTSFSDKPASMAQHPELSVDVRPVESALLRDDSELSDNGVVDIGVKDGFEGDEVNSHLLLVSVYFYSYMFVSLLLHQCPFRVMCVSTLCRMCISMCMYVCTCSVMFVIFWSYISM